jgi:hypothetical protein
MKKMIGLAVAVMLGVAINANAQVDASKKTEMKGGTTTTTTEVKNTATGAKATEKVTTNASSTTTEEKVKGKNVKIDKTTTDTATGQTGSANVAVKKGAIEDMKIDWTYQTVTVKPGVNNYVVEYTINDKTNKSLVKELNLTPDQAKAIVPGTHKIVSTSEFTADDIRNNLRAVILKDISTTIGKTNAVTRPESKTKK